MSRFQSRWLAWQGEERTSMPANRGDKSAKSLAGNPSVTFGTAISRTSAAQHAPLTLDADASTIAAVKLRNTIIGDLWLVADDDAVTEHPDIIRAGLPVFFFHEVEMLRGKTPAELKAIGMVKASFPTGRVLQ